MLVNSECVVLFSSEHHAYFIYEWSKCPTFYPLRGHLNNSIERFLYNFRMSWNSIHAYSSIITFTAWHSFQVKVKVSYNRIMHVRTELNPLSEQDKVRRRLQSKGLGVCIWRPRKFSFLYKGIQIAQWVVHNRYRFSSGVHLQYTEF